MRFLDYIFYCAYSHYKNINSGDEMVASIIYTWLVCDRLLFPIYKSLEYLCFGHSTLSFWKVLVLESPLIVFLIYRYVKHKKTILKKFAHCNHSKKFLAYFIFLLLFGISIITLILSIYLKNQILKRGLEGTWNIPEFFSNFAGI